MLLILCKDRRRTMSMSIVSVRMFERTCKHRDRLFDRSTNDSSMVRVESREISSLTLSCTHRLDVKDLFVMFDSIAEEINRSMFVDRQQA
jgi:hypothetical protein